MRRALRSNGAYCVASGTAVAALATSIDERVGLDAWLLAAVGISLVGYGIFVMWAVGQPKLFVPTAQMAIAGDLGWIVMAVVVIGAGWMTTTGNVVLALLTVVVAGFAIVQQSLYRRLRAS